MKRMKKKAAALLVIFSLLLTGCGAENKAENGTDSKTAAGADLQTGDAGAAETSGDGAASGTEEGTGKNTAAGTGEETDPNASYTKAEYLGDLPTGSGASIRLSRENYVIHMDETNFTDTVLDLNGNALFQTGYGESSDSHRWDITDGDIIGMVTNKRGNGTVQFFDASGKELAEFNHSGDDNYFYGDGIIYHMVGSADDEPQMTAAYDLKEGKELWETVGDEPILLENGFVCLKQSKYSKHWNRVVNGKTGEVLAYEGDDGSEILVSEGAVALDKKTELRVYDFNGNETACYVYQKDDTSSEYCDRLLNTGAFVIGDGKKDTCKIYSKDGTLITELDVPHFDTYPTFSITLDRTVARTKAERQEQSSSSYAIVRDNRDCYYAFFDDDTWTCIGKNYSDDPPVINGCFAACVDEDGKDLEELNVKVVNMKTKQEKVLTEPVDTDFEVSDGYGCYIFRGSWISGASSYYVYDRDFNLIYESDAQLEVVNDSCFLEAEDEQLTLIDMETLERRPLDTEGKFCVCSKTNLLTYGEDGIKHFYRFR